MTISMNDGDPSHVGRGTLGDRIKLAADRIGGLQSLVPLLTDVSRRTLSDYVANKSEPKASTLVEICEATGVSVQWLASGVGEISYADKLSQRTHTISEDVMLAIKQLVARQYSEAGIHLPDDSLLRTAVASYNALIMQCENSNDPEELNSLLPWLERKIARQVAASRADPGTGKRLA